MEHPTPPRVLDLASILSGSLLGHEAKSDPSYRVSNYSVHAWTPYNNNYRAPNIKRVLVRSPHSCFSTRIDEKVRRDIWDVQKKGQFFKSIKKKKIETRASENEINWEPKICIFCKLLRRKKIVKNFKNSSRSRLNSLYGVFLFSWENLMVPFLFFFKILFTWCLVSDVTSFQRKIRSHYIGSRRLNPLRFFSSKTNPIFSLIFPSTAHHFFSFFPIPKLFFCLLSHR